MNIIKRNNQQQIRCHYYPLCDYSNASGIEITKHVQRVHVSRNENAGMRWYPDWVKGRMPITDVGGIREKLESRRKLNGRRIA